MKCKVLSLILVFTMLFTTVYVGFNVSAEAENLLANGNFESYEGYTPANWKVNVTENASAEIVEDVNIADGVTANAVKFVTSAENPNKRSDLYYTGTVKIEKNAKYTTTYWVKMNNIKGFRTYMYEPDFIAKDGSAKTSETAAEGMNIYSFRFDNGSTRVIRTDITHYFKIAESGTIIDAAGPSMFISRANNVEQPLTPDYPSTERQGEWLQVIHTFETGNLEAHEADISYHFTVPEAVDGELWIADIQMTVEKSGIIDFYTPTVNDVTLGCVEPAGEVPIYENIENTITAVPFGENTFVGWYNGDELVSTDAELTFMYEKDVTPVYEARFEKGAFGIDGSFESGYENGQLLTQSIVTAGPGEADSNWTAEAYLASEKKNSGFYIDSSHGGDWRKAKITTTKAHSGSYSVDFSGQYGAIGRKFTGLAKNANYIVSVYALTEATKDSNFAGVNTFGVTAADQSIIGLRTEGKYDYLNSTTYDGVLAYKYLPVDTTKGWTKLDFEFNTGDNTEVIFWLSSNGTNAHLYLDDYAISRGNIKYTPEVNDPKLGFVNTVSTKDGEITTIVATPLGEAYFAGWYENGELVSGANEHTFTYSSANPPKYVAHFAIDDGYIELNGGYETGYTVNQVVAQEAGTKLNTWTEESFLESSKDGGNHYFVSTFGDTWRKATVTDEMAHSGKNSLKIAGQYGYVGKKIAGLRKDTDYIVSFYSYLTAQDGDPFTGISNTMITEPDVGATLPSGNEIKIRAITNAGVLAKDVEKYSDMRDTWAKHEILFNSGDNEEVILWVNPNGKNAALYLDDFAIARAVTVTVMPSRYGTVENVPVGKIARNTILNIIPKPYEGNTFEGWYMGDTLVSEIEVFNFPADDMVLTPKFSGETAVDYDQLSAYGQDGTFENGTVGPWVFSDPDEGDTVDWCSMVRSTDEAYEGEYSLAAFSRHRDNILKLENLVAHTRYTLSFYYKYNVVGEKEYMGVSGITPTDVTHFSEGAKIIANTDATPFTGEWQKYELSFNSGNYSELNFILTYGSEDVNAKLYMDNFTLMVGDKEDHAYGNACDADCNYCGEIREVPDHNYGDGTVCIECGHISFTPGNINGDEDVNLEDVVVLSQYVAGWQGIDYITEALDPDGNGTPDLSDVVLLSQYVAGWDVTLSDEAYVPAK